MPAYHNKVILMVLSILICTCFIVKKIFVSQNIFYGLCSVFNQNLYFTDEQNLVLYFLSQNLYLKERCSVFPVGRVGISEIVDPSLERNIKSAPCVLLSCEKLSPKREFTAELWPLSCDSPLSYHHRCRRHLHWYDTIDIICRCDNQCMA